MIEIHNEKVKNIPLLHVVKSEHRNLVRPMVFFIHGFTSAKEHNLHFAYLLAEKGFRVVLPDVDLHGERNNQQTRKEMMFQFWRIVVQTIAELEEIKNEFVDRELAEAENVGLVGTSMGGIVTFGALTQYKWIKAAVSLMGSPNYEKLAKRQIAQLKKAGIQLPFSDEELEREYEILKRFDLSVSPEKLAQRPLLIWHGKQDPIVPFQPTYDFYKKHKEEYTEVPANLQFIIEEKTGHKVSREALLKTVDWFDEHLSPQHDTAINI
ncbi:alpha/beta fold hydrolase [Bacillus sp. SD088]|uniref:alpha/beta fold hydrolase n=1 Tax=Bacillus sp. SD088 TaxID=2782012 RepID=UPI001A9727A4|nr:alpha/beta fold hydrolase [Bacillus sp. SD088]MBO0993657.1 prolyl oligopeptidase family serine peptidase [Bacillus sp. SD088]